MPATIDGIGKTPDGIKNKPSETSEPQEMKKQTSSGNKPVKKPVGSKSKKVVGEKDKDVGRRVGSVIMDKVPKKNAQRTKGSISLGKALEKRDGSASKSRPTSASVDRIRPETREGTVTGMEKTPNGQRVRPGKGTEERTLHSARSRKTITSATKKEDQRAEDRRAEEQEEPEALGGRPEENTEELPPLGGLPSSTCSFFGKLQQGVKAYFSSRNSLEDKNKKKVTEGGIRTHGGVAKGAKEECKKRMSKVSDFHLQEVNLLNKIKNSDGPGLNLKSGGQSSYFLSNKPKISRDFQKLKRKKLYHPKKHYVRIEIPRKGYFYRSTVHFKDPGSSVLQHPRLQHESMAKNESKIQISRVAPPSTTGSHIYKKRLTPKKQGRCSAEVEDSDSQESNDVLQNLLESLRVHEGIPFKPEYLKCMSFLLLKTKTVSEVIDNFPEPDFDHLMISAERSKENEGQVSALSETLESSKEADHQLGKKSALKIRSCINDDKWKSGSEGDDPLATSDVYGESDIREAEKDEVLSSEESLESTSSTASDCLSKGEVVSKEEPNCLREITALKTFHDDISLPATVENQQMMIESLPYGEPVMAPVSEEPSPDSGIEKPIKITTKVGKVCGIEKPCDEPTWTSFPPLHRSSSDIGVRHLPWNCSEDNLAASLMDDTDLHVELQNYLKATTNSSDSKSALENCFAQEVEPHRFPNKRSDLFDLGDIQSASSFASATSVCNNPGSKQGGEENEEVRPAFNERNHEVVAIPESQLDSQRTKAFTSQMQIFQEKVEVRKIKSEEDPKKFQQDFKPRSPVRRTSGKTSFRILREDDQETCRNPPVKTEGIERCFTQAPDGYDKIFPFTRPTENNEKSSKSSFLFKNLVCSLSADSENSSATNQSILGAISSKKIVEATDQASGAEELASREISPSETPSKTSRWSPSLQELISIYNSVLKEDQKMRLSGSNRLKRCISAHLFSFLSNKFHEGKYKSELVKLSRDQKIRALNLTDTWKRSGSRKESIELKEYVNVFQEILSSSLSISQISRMNDIMADLQEYMASQKIQKKPLKTKQKGKEAILKVTLKTNEEKPKKKLESGERTVKRKPEMKKPPTVKKPAPRITLREEKEKPPDEVKRVDFTSPKDLESVLQTCFHDDPPRVPSHSILGPGHSKKKILVSVKLCGDQILVSHMSYFKNEKSLTKMHNSDRQESSELIIENVKSFPSRSRTKVLPRKPISSSQAVKSKKKSAKCKKTETISERSMAVAEEEEEIKTESLTTVPGTPPPIERRKSFLKFEYNQELLKVQHPIEAIIESSESKVEEQVENAEKICQGVVKPRTDVNRKGAAANNFIFSKELAELNTKIWIGEEQKMTLDRTKSYIIHSDAKEKNSSEQTGVKAKRLGNPQKKVKSLDDTSILQKPKAPGSRRKARKVMPGRPRSTVFCYPLLYKAHEESQIKIKTKTKDAKDSKTGKKMSLCTPFTYTKTFKKFPKKSDKMPKKSSRDSKPKTRKVEVKADSSAHSSASVDGCPDRLSTNTILFLNTGISPDGYSVEFLLNDRSDCQPMNVSEKSSSPEVGNEDLEERAKEASLGMNTLDRETASTIQVSSEVVGRTKESPIVLHAFSRPCDDTSSPSLMIQSDSHLKCCSSFALTKGKVNGLFRSNSDTKFYPGRERDTRREENLGVTFVLTAKQKEVACVPSDQVQVVTRTDAVKETNQVDATKDKSHSVEEKVNDKLPLNSIEEFINILSTKRKHLIGRSPHEPQKPPKKEKLEGRRMGLNCNSNFVPCQRIQALYSSDRKAYHECQLRRLAEKKINKIKDSGKKEAKKTGKKEAKKTGKKEMKPPEYLIAGLSSQDQIFNVRQENCNEGKEETPAPDEENKENAVISSEASAYIFGAETKKETKAENAKSKEHNLKKCNEKLSEKISKNEILRLIENAINATQGLKNKKKILSAIEEELKRKDMERVAVKRKIKSPSSLKSLKGVNLPKKLKMVRIKIHWNKEASRGCQLRPRAASPGDARRMSKQVLPQQTMEAVGVLESPVCNGPDVGDIGRTQSTYFDAKEDEGSEDEVSNHNLGEEEPFLSEFQDSFGEEHVWPTIEESRQRVSLTPSDECLLSRDFPTENWEEKIFNKISKELESGSFNYSRTLIQILLMKTKNLSTNRDNPCRTMQALQSIANQSRSLIATMEKNAWMKILTLLEEVLEAFETQNGNFLEFMTNQIKRTKECVDKVQMLNRERLGDSRSVGLSQGHVNNFSCAVTKITDSLKAFRDRLLPGRDSSEVEKPGICSRENIFDVPQSHGQKRQEDFVKTSLRPLITEIRQQRLYVQYMINADYGTVLPETQNLKRRVAEKMKSLEEKMSSLEGSCGSQKGSPEDAHGDTFRDMCWPSLRTTRNHKGRNVGESGTCLWGEREEEQKISGP